MPAAGVAALLEHIVDYAGLFPPAGLAMRPTVENYARYFAGDDAWMLARLIVPVGRLDEFESEAARWLPTNEDAEPWRISALLPPLSEGALGAAIDRLGAFNEAHSAPEAGLAVVDAAETRAANAHEIDRALEALPDALHLFFEIPWNDDPRGMIATLAGTGASAKIRTGGVTPDAIPPVGAVARFIDACAAGHVAFKATAGLHHPVRSERALTYDGPEPRGVMHGFLNVFLGAALRQAGAIDLHGLERMLDDRSAGHFALNESGASWEGHRLDASALARSRDTLAVGFGSCSFEEPLADLRELGVLPPTP